VIVLKDLIELADLAREAILGEDLQERRRGV
jgi:hypothetical protein